MNLKITKLQPEAGNALSLILEKPDDFHFYPGQYLDYELGDTRSFTISASPTEKFLMLTAKKGLSEFKKTLFELNPNETISASSPIGTFILDETSPAVFIAGGVGITPFRSMIKYALDQKLTTPITLIYTNSDENFIFKDELNGWQKLMPHFKISYVNTTTQGRLNREKLQQLYPLPLTLNAILYLSGPPKFVDHIQKILLDLEVDETSIRSDYFDGYE